MAKNSHLMMWDGSNPEHPRGFGCLNCGVDEALPKSLPVEVFLYWAKQFKRSHAGCQKPLVARSGLALLDSSIGGTP